MLYSFDIFDTIITRITATPQGVFALMQEKLEEDGRFSFLPEHIRSNFCLLRTYAESLAHLQYMQEGIQEVTLEQIYAALSLTSQLVPEQTGILQDFEVETEQQCMRPIEENIKRIEELFDRGERVVLISDMYLDRKVIRKMLSKASPVLEKLPLYLSSDWKKNKWNGSLFQIVKEQEKVEYRDWIHMGDNLRSDVEVPERYGIQAKWYKWGDLLEKESELIRLNSADAHYQLNIGAAGFARRNRIVQDNVLPVKTTAWKIGCTYAGPILYPYVRWILSESASSEIKRLYFIARDGFILKQIADIIIREDGLNIQTFYLYGSRKAWRMPSFFADSAVENSDIQQLMKWSHERKILTLNQLAEVFEIEYGDFAGFLPESFVKDGFPLDRRRLLYCERRLNENPDFKKFLIDKHKEKRKLTIDYLKQELDVSDDCFAFVELAGSGYTQECLAHLMRKFYGKTIRTFFFKMDRIEYNRELCQNRVFFTGLMKRHIMIEIICRAPHGQTTGYREENGIIVPCLEEWESKAFLEAGYDKYIEGILEFTGQYHKSISSFPTSAFRIDIMHQYLQYLSEEPSQEILQFFGDMPNNETGREQKVTCFAPSLSRRDLRRLYLGRTTEPVEQFYEGTYLEYSLLRCSERDLKQIDFYKNNNGKLLGRTYRILKSTRIFGTGTAEGRQERYRRIEKHEIDPALLSGRIALYAAGKVGQSLYRQIKRTKQAQLVLWVDQNGTGQADCKTDNAVSGDFFVQPVKMLGSISFDILLIAILNLETAKAVRRNLMEMGIPDSKIFLYYEWKI